MQVNVIGSEVQKTAVNGKSWSLEASQKLERDISLRMNQGHFNIRLVQPGDNLIRIAAALSHRQVVPPEIDDFSWRNIPVVYLGDSDQIRAQRTDNPNYTLLNAWTIHPGQYVAWADVGEVLVADRLDVLVPQPLKA
jgi:hypothetical protein